MYLGAWIGRELLAWRQGAAAAYDPASDRWRPITSTGQPAGDGSFRFAVWTGREMIIWGGTTLAGQHTNTGALYEP